MSYQGSVKCSGTCPCGSHGPYSGSFSDGPGNYGSLSRSQTCSWLVDSCYPTNITVSFASFDTERDRDFVTINECSSASCATRRQLARLSGNVVSASTNYTASTGFLEVVFTSDSYNSYAAGFEAAWRMETIMMTECLECPVGTYADVSGSSSCTECPAGSFQKGTGATGCIACPILATSPAGSTNQGACFCKEGFSGDGTSSCKACTPGNYRGKPSVTCSGTCPCGLHGPYSGSISDGPGSYGNSQTCSWLVASSVLTSIMIAFSSFDTERYSDFVTINECSSASCATRRQLARLSGNVVSASTNYTASTGFLEVVFTSDSYNSYAAGFEAAWRMETIMMTECLECPVGTYADVSGSSSCTECPAGSFQKGTGATGCVACPANTSSTVGSVVCLCDSGYSGDGTSSCKACTPGKYRGSVTCSGTCPCGLHGPSSGSISDGPGNYGNSQTCSWLVATNNSRIAIHNVGRGTCSKERPCSKCTGDCNSDDDCSPGLQVSFVI
jgi:hypothetical protein